MQQHRYPVHVAIQYPETSSRFWAVPVVGAVVKAVILIPSAILLYVLQAVVNLLQLVLWIPVLFGGRYPDWGFDLVAGTIRWTICVYAFMLGLTDRYPPFRLSGQAPAGETPYPVAVEFVRPETSNRLWAIPLVGLAIKLLILIPHIIVLYVLLFVVELLQLVTWIPVLFAGRYPSWGMSICGGSLRWSARVAAYMVGLTDEYPPFGLDGGETAREASLAV